MRRSLTAWPAPTVGMNRINPHVKRSHKVVDGITYPGGRLFQSFRASDGYTIFFGETTLENIVIIVLSTSVMALLRVRS